MKVQFVFEHSDPEENRMVRDYIDTRVRFVDEKMSSTGLFTPDFRITITCETLGRAVKLVEEVIFDINPKETRLFE